ncbi:MAG: HPF/RaiA family ribosome-associated protein [Planctomycetota bacterium]|nr:HPF/RaiA family ribosome-associated protein [Planctomycetota bacterium]
MAAKSKVIGSRKAPLGSGSPRATRAGRGRTDAAATPLAIHTQGVAIHPPLEKYLHAKLGARLGKYAIHIERVTARFEDFNGPRGGIDTECRIKVVLESRPTIQVSARGRDARRAFDAVLGSLTRAVGRDLERAGFSERGSVKAAAKKPAEHAESAEPETETEASGPKRPSRRSTRGSPDGMRSGVGLQKRALTRTISGQSKARAAAARGRGTR